MTERIATQRLVLAHPAAGDGLALLRYRLSNRMHLSAWEPLRAASFYTLEDVELQLRQMREQLAGGGAVHWLLARQGSTELIGLCSFTNIVRGPFQACHLGFSLSEEHQGKGYMAEALQAAIAHIFQSIGLHRIMANYQPANVRSAALLQRLGFEREGLARRYLKINGHWADHVLTSLINPHDD